MGGLEACGLDIRSGGVIVWHWSDPAVKVDPTQTFSLTFASAPVSLSSQTSACLSVFLSVSVSLSAFTSLFPLYRWRSLPPPPRGVNNQSGGGERSSSSHAPIYRQQTLGKRKVDVR